MANRSNPNPRRSSGSGNMDETQVFRPVRGGGQTRGSANDGGYSNNNGYYDGTYDDSYNNGYDGYDDQNGYYDDGYGYDQNGYQDGYPYEDQTATMVMTTAITMTAIRSPISPGKPWPPGQQGVPVPIPIAVRAVPLVVPLAAPSSPGRKSRKSASAMRTIISIPPPAAVEKSIIPSGIS